MLQQLHLHSRLNTWLQWIEQWQLQVGTRNISVLRFGVAYIRGLTVIMTDVDKINRYQTLTKLNKAGTVCKKMPLGLYRTGDNLGVLGYIAMNTIIQTLKNDSKVHGANMGPTWGRQDPCGPHVGHVNFAIWEEIIFTFNDTLMAWYLCHYQIIEYIIIDSIQ